jgi:hypothetical protein
MIRNDRISSIGLWTFLLMMLMVTPAAQAEETEHESHHHKNHIGVFAGLTHERRENGFALGLDYARRLNESFSIGGFAERTWGDFNFDVYGISVAYHVDKWTWAIGPGIEDSQLGNERLWRLGVGYSIDLDERGTILTPNFYIDIVDGEQVYVLGVALGRGF